MPRNKDADELRIEFGSGPASLTLVIHEDMIDQLVVLTDAQARFRELDEEAERGIA